MSLMSAAFEDCVTLIPTLTPDSAGSQTVTWAEGVPFKAAFDFQASMEARIAEKQGVTGLWDIYVERSVNLEFHNVFKRKSDGQIFRVTSKDDKKTPKGAGLNLRLLAAEEWEPI